MRFDDRLTTILDGDPGDERGRVAAWIQLVDLLAQDRGQFSAMQRRAAIDRLVKWRSAVPDRRRLASGVSIAGRPLPADLVAFFGADSAQVAAPVIARAQLPAGEWEALLADLPSSSRAILRERRDLPAETTRALGSFGSSDFALSDTRSEEQRAEPLQAAAIEPTAAEPASAEPAEVAAEVAAPLPVIETAPPPAEATAISTSIHALVERIDRWRVRQMSGQTKRQVRRISDFAFETDTEGLITWVEGAPRGGLIGLSIGALADAGGWGVDGQAAGAFRKRAEIRDARLLVAGEAAVSGEWRLIADPRFAAANGRFQGYRGIARRDGAVAVSAVATGLPAGSIRQLIHELRTPLNAIRGFGEMIEGQFLGPVAAGYRARARAIVHDSGELLRVFEDLDASARLESADYPMSPDAQVDLSEIVRAVALLHADLVDQRGIRLRVVLPARDGLMVALDRASALRMVDRMLGAALSTTQAGDVSELALNLTDGHYELSIGCADAAEPEDDVDSFAPLGRDFSLRLATRLAERCGGRLEQRAGSFCLILPPMKDSALKHVERI